MTGFDVLAEGLRFPEGPVLFADGSLAVTEIAGGCITRIDADGAKPPWRRRAAIWWPGLQVPTLATA